MTTFDKLTHQLIPLKFEQLSKIRGGNPTTDPPDNNGQGGGNNGDSSGPQTPPE